MRKLFTLILGILALASLTVLAERTMYVKHKANGVLSFKLSAKDSVYFWNTVSGKDADESELLMYVRTAEDGLKTIPYKQVDSIYFGKTETPVVAERDYIEDGALTKATFKVSATKSVNFSQGNLQFNAVQGARSTNPNGAAQGTWRFAENQYEVIGDGNTNIAKDYDGWIDLFGWGTSGWNSKKGVNLPWSTSEVETDYYPDGQSHDFEYTPLADWGVFNVISNGGKGFLWRTLTADEWDYLFENSDWTLGYVKTSDGQSMLCYLLLPEGFKAPSGINVSVISSLSGGADDEIAEGDYAKNSYSTEQFAELEKLGVVALPCGGYRRGVTVKDVRSGGNYWSASGSDEGLGYSFTFSSTSVNPLSDSYLSDGLSVRLVRDFNFDIRFVNWDGTILLDTVVERGVAPTYTRGVPTRASTRSYTFEFKGWNRLLFGATDDVVYTAVYDSTLSGAEIANGAMIGATFKVSDTKSVYFSQGNLQFNAAQGTHATADGKTAQGTWRFAEYQYDYVGAGNSSISSTYDGWIDLFGFGTSGWNSGANAYQPWSTSEYNQDYYPGGKKSNGLTGDYANADWGVYNAISNGGNEPNQWRTLTEKEWVYLFENNKWTLGRIEGHLCFLLLPKEFYTPRDVSVTVLSTSATITDAVANNLTVPSGNTYTDAQFRKLEKLGVVALPCGGARVSKANVAKVYSAGSFAYYWYTDVADALNASGFRFSDTYVDMSYDYYRYNGRSVRLVQDAPRSDGALIKASYKVSATKSVYFSQGNLQYNAMQGTHKTLDSTAQGTWRFALKQWDVVGLDNNSILSTYNGWIDLFGWGTSGWNSGATEYQPWSTSTASFDYYPGGSETNDLTGSYAKADWGVFNAISNGGDEPNKWRTLTTDEWRYLFREYDWTLGSLKVGKKLHSCFLLLPDAFVLPDGMSMDILSKSVKTSEDYVNGQAIPSTNTYTEDQLRKLEMLGVVVLPCAGYRRKTGVRLTEYSCFYWSVTAYDIGYTYGFGFLPIDSATNANPEMRSSLEVGSFYFSRFLGHSVRLVQDVQ